MNIAEILKYCPKGTKLYSPIWGIVRLIEVSPTKVIKIKVCNHTEELTSTGCYSVMGECVLFPSKDQRDWDKFRLSVKKGDIMMSIDGSFVFIANDRFNSINELFCPKSICDIKFDTFKIGSANSVVTCFYIPASEEAKKELFDKMAEAGYKWNADTLELEKIGPKFKEGDVVISKSGNLYLIADINNRNVITGAVLYADGDFIPYDIYHPLEFKNFNLASKEERNKFYSILIKEGFKYDKEQHLLIKQKFKPFDKVLVRNNAGGMWIPSLFTKYIDGSNFKYLCFNGLTYAQCIPYEDNEYLAYTTDSPT